MAPYLQHESRNRELDCKLLRESDLFDFNWSVVGSTGIRNVDVVEHYLLHGWQSGLEPNAAFEGKFLYPYFRVPGMTSSSNHFSRNPRHAQGWPTYPEPSRCRSLGCAHTQQHIFSM